MPSELKSRWPEINKQMDSAITTGLEKSAEQMKFRIIGELYEIKSGRRYGSHQASAPGESPASDTKLLEGSLQIEAETSKQFAVSANTPYAKRLEFGDSVIAARPMWEPVAQEMGGEQGAVAKTVVTEVVRTVK